MARLPQPGGDKGSWGEVLNDYLSQAHNPDGTLKDIPQNKVTTLVADLANKANTSAIPTTPAQVGAEPVGLSTATKNSLNTNYARPEGAWAANTAYAINSIVINAGSVYLAAASVPARSTFTAADWQPLGGISTPSTRKSNRVAILGDSTMTDGGVGSRSHVMNWPDLACMMSGQRMLRGANFALGGYTANGVRTQQLPQVLADAEGFGAALICVGTNDIATGKGGIASGITPEMTKSEITLIDSTLSQAGIEPIWVTIPPRTAAAVTNGSTTPVSNVHAKTQALNAWLKDFAKSKGRRVIDLYAQAVNVSTGEYKTAYSADGIHAAGPGIVYEAERAVLELAATFPNYEPPLAGSFDEFGASNQMMPNPLFTTDSNSDGVPDGWSVDTGSSSNYSVTLASGPGVVGKEMIISNVGSPPGGARVISNVISATPGDKIAFGGRFRCTSTFGNQAVRYTIKLTYVGASANQTLIPVNIWQATLPGFATFWIEDIVPAGTTGIQAEVLTTTTSQGKVYVSQMTIRNLSAELSSGWWTS